MYKPTLAIKTRVIVCLAGCLTIQVVFGNMLMFRNLCMVKGPVEGADKKGHAVVIEQLGMIGDKVYGTPIYAYWSSGSDQTSPYLGYGWHLPIAESRIVPLDAARFEMRRPDGGVELIVRDRKDKNKLRGRRYWHGEVRGDEIRIFTLKDCRHGQCELVFRNGRLVRFRDGSINASLAYRGRHLESVDFNGKEALFFSRIASRNDEWQIRFGSKKIVRLRTGKANFPHASGKAICKSTLTEIAFTDGTSRIVSYGIDKDGNGMVNAQESQTLWDAKKRTILAKDGWNYEVKDPKPDWNNVFIRRFNKRGEAECEYYDLQTGMQTKEVGHTKTVMRLFTSGPLKGKARWAESYHNGELQTRGEYAYDENGGLIYCKSFDRHSSSTAGKKDMVEKWCEPNGHILKTRKNGDDSTIQEYIYTPEGRRVAVICGDRIVSECVGNAKEFVAWYKDKQKGKNVPVPKIVEWRDVPLPEHVRKAIPPDLHKDLVNDGW